MKLFHELFTFFCPAFFGLALDGDGSVGSGAAVAGSGANAGGDNNAVGGGGERANADAGAETIGADGGNAGGSAAAVAVVAGPIIGSDGKFMPGWAKQLGGNDALEAKFTDPKALVGSYVSLEKMISAKGIIPPGPNATPEEKSAFFKALGRPDKPEEYGIKMPEKIGDKAVPKELWDQNNATAFAKWAHEKGWSKQQVQDAIEFDMGRAMAGHEAMVATSTKARTDAETALKTEHGAQYPEFVAKAERGAAALGLTKEMVAADPALANNPNFIRMAAKVAEMIGEKGAAGARGTTHATENPQAKIDAIMADKSHPWHQKNASKDMKAHNDAVLEMQRLYKAKHGEV